MKSPEHMCSSKDDVNRDRLSEMPDEILVHILSHMPTLDAVRTVALRRFGKLWTLVHTLRFDTCEFLMVLYPKGGWGEDKFWRFYVFVRNVMILHKTLSIEKFHLCVDYYYFDVRNKGFITMLLRFALDRQAKEIEFVCTDTCIPSSVFPYMTSHSLVTLHLSYCKIDCKLKVNLPSLKELVLFCISMCEDAFEHFLLGCPSLRELDIEDPFGGIKKLSFSAPNIDTLSFAVICDYDQKDPWLLDIPNLKSLVLDLDKLPQIMDASSVRDIYIKEFFNVDDEKTMLEMFWRKFEGTEVLQFSCYASRQFLDAIQYLDLTQNRWKRVVLELQAIDKGCLSGIHQLGSVKHLEKLIIYTIEVGVSGTSTSHIHKDLENISELPPLDLSSPCMIKLKTVTLDGYGYMKPWNHELHLVEFLLKSAAVLEKLLIVPSNQLTGVEKLESIKHVSSFQRVSPSAKVVFA